MTDKTPRLRRAALLSSKNPRRSPLFHWLRRHHRQLADTQTGECRDWAPLLEKAIEAGVTDDRGAKPTARLMRDTWRKVRSNIHAKVEAQANSPEPPRKLQPRDLPADWKPMPIPASAPPAVAGQSSTALPPLTHPSQTRVIGQASFGVITSGPLTPEPDYTGMGIAEAKIARARWHIALRQPG